MANLQQQLIAIRMADGSVAIMAFLTVGRGCVLPRGARWRDIENALWEREPTRGAVDREIAAALPAGGVISWRLIDAAEVPSDRTFRDAWTDTDVGVIHDIEKAREIKRAQLRLERAPLLAELDAEWMRATGQKQDQTIIDAIEAQRQALRDAPADLRIDAANTVEELKLVSLTVEELKLVAL